MTKQKLLDTLTLSTLKEDPKKCPLFEYVDRMCDVLLCCEENEEIPLLEDTSSILQTQSCFEQFIRSTDAKELRDWLINLLAQCQMYVSRRSLMACVNDVRRINRCETIFRRIMIPLVLFLITVALVFTVLGLAGVIKENLANKISTGIGTADFILAGVFFVCEQISDNHKKKSFQLEETTRIKDDASTLEAMEKTVVNINISNDDHSTKDNSTHIWQGPLEGEGGMQVGENNGTITQNNTFTRGDEK